MPDDVVALGGEQDGNDEGDGVCDARKAHIAQRANAKRRDRAGEPDRRGERIRVEDLLEGKGFRIAREVVIFECETVGEGRTMRRVAADHFDERPAVHRLPEEIRQQHERRQRDGAQRVLREHDVAPPGDEQPADRGDDEQRHRIFGVRTQRDRDRQRGPEVRQRCRRRAQDPYGEIDRRSPEKGLKRRRRQRRAEQKIRGKKQRRQPREELRKAAAAELFGQHRAEIDGPGGGKNRQRAQRQQLVSSGRGEPGGDGNERRLVDVTPRQVLRTGDEVELVAEVAVSPGRRAVQQQGRRRAGPPRSCRPASENQQTEGKAADARPYPRAEGDVPIPPNSAVRQRA